MLIALTDGLHHLSFLDRDRESFRRSVPLSSLIKLTVFYVPAVISCNREQHGFLQTHAVISLLSLIKHVPGSFVGLCALKRPSMSLCLAKCKSKIQNKDRLK